MDKFRETILRILAHNTLIWEWFRGHKKYLKIRQKWRKRAAATALFQLHEEVRGQLYHPCKTTSLVLTICAKEWYGESPQKAGEGDKFRRFRQG